MLTLITAMLLLTIASFVAHVAKPNRFPVAIAVGLLILLQLVELLPR